MALGDDFFIQTFTTTLQKYEKQLVDNIMLSHPTLELFKANAKSQTGRGLVVPVRAANLGATGYSDASGTHSTAVSSDIMGSAVFTWASGIITPFRLQHRDILQNSGPEQIVSLVEEYVKGAAGDHGDFITAELHAAGADWAAGSILSMDVLFGNAASDAALDATNPDWVPVGGINPNDAGKEYWQSTRLYVPATGTGSLDIVAAFRKTLNEIYRASRKRPNVCIAGFDIYEELEAFLQDKGQYQNPGGTAQTRFSEIKVGDLTVRLDPDCDDDRAYFISPDSLRFAYCAGEFMKAYPAQPLQGTLDTVVPLASTLQVGVAERRANGLLIRQAAPGS
jgi:hypothetical protein